MQRTVAFQLSGFYCRGFMGLGRGLRGDTRLSKWAKKARIHEHLLGSPSEAALEPGAGKRTSDSSQVRASLSQG